MKKFSALLIVFSMLLMSFGIVPTLAEGEKLKTDKTVYEFDDPIMVTATGSGKDWVGIYTPSATASLYWAYVDASADKGVGSGVAFDIKKAPNKKGSAPAVLPAGEYVIRLMPNDTSDLSKALETINITIKPRDNSEIAPESGGDLTKLNVPKTTYKYSEPINISAIGSGKDWVGIYYPDAAHSLYWTYIDKSASQGIGSGVEFDMRNAPKKKDNAPVPLLPGKYVIRLMPNDSENISDTVAWVNITIAEPDESEITRPEKPISAEYKLENDTDGFSKGTLTIKLAKDNPAKDFVCYWANEQGKLEGYTALAKFKVTGETTTRKIPGNILIPQGATKLLIYTSLDGIMSNECFEIKLPQSAASKDFGKPLVEFQVVSDVHITANSENAYNKQFTAMLKDVVKVSPTSAGLFIVGDMATSGSLAEFKQLVSMHSAVNGAPPYFMAIGNHDLYNGSLQEKTEQFLQYAMLPDGTHPTSTHYDFWLNGYHYVFLGNDKLVDNVDATLNAETLDWLDKTLAKDRDEGKPTFLFMHQSIYNTIAGSMPGQGWDGVLSYQNLKNVLKKYPEVILFNGHSHWTLDSDNCMYERTNTLPTIFNTASVAYLWTSYNVAAGERLEGSQGYYIYVYEDKVIVRGRDFITGEWVSSAQFVVDYSLNREVSFKHGGIGNAIPSLTVANGEKINLPTPTADGYVFEGWFTDSEHKNAFDANTPITEDILLYAKWSEAAETTPQETTPPGSAQIMPGEDSSPLPIIIAAIAAVVAIAAISVIVVIKKKK